MTQPAATRSLFTTTVAALVVAGAAGAGPVADMITEAKEAGSRAHPTEASVHGIKLSLREIGPSGVTEALSILDAQAETDDVLAGLLRGLSLIHELSDPGILTTLCSYDTAQGGERLQAEAQEALRVRCALVPAECTCP